eukprot:TRINITY_DN6327_c0_g1_i1.p1 TRINITY_DN6327_c0_g1~~TRINITY_DN6327_c0_g1_i1.p1  ORF type:complete len:148 (+),score=5.98 TRINITY_DN6327_c0_g1_i1:112-555(+)
MARSHSLRTIALATLGILLSADLAFLHTRGLAKMTPDDRALQRRADPRQHTSPGTTAEYRSWVRRYLAAGFALGLLGSSPAKGSERMTYLQGEASAAKAEVASLRKQLQELDRKPRRSGQRNRAVRSRAHPHSELCARAKGHTGSSL